MSNLEKIIEALQAEIATAREEGFAAGVEAAVKVCEDQVSEATELGQTEAVFWAIQLKREIRAIKPA